MKHFTRFDDDFLQFTFADPEPHLPLQHVAKLFVIVLVERHDASLFEMDLSQHDPITMDHLPADPRGECFGFNLIPSLEQIGLGIIHVGRLASLGETA
jgi:hypothetical protein